MTTEPAAMAAVYLRHFTAYLSAGSPQEAHDVVEQIRWQGGGGYEFWTDHWPRSPALYGPGLAQDQAHLAPLAPVRSVATRERLTAQWKKVSDRWAGLEHEWPERTTVVNLGGLGVKVPYLRAVRHEEHGPEVLYVAADDHELPLYIQLGVLRVLQRAYSGIEASFVDLPRGTVNVSRERSLTAYDDWLTQAGADLAEHLAGQDDDGGGAAPPPLRIA